MFPIGDTKAALDEAAARLFQALRKPVEPRRVDERRAVQQRSSLRFVDRQKQCTPHGAAQQIADCADIGSGRAALVMSNRFDEHNTQLVQRAEIDVHPEPPGEFVHGRSCELANSHTGQQGIPQRDHPPGQLILALAVSVQVTQLHQNAGQPGDRRFRQPRGSDNLAVAHHRLLRREAGKHFKRARDRHAPGAFGANGRALRCYHTRVGAIPRGHRSRIAVEGSATE